jgi:putative ABC transport system ATP-binding protein
MALITHNADIAEMADRVIRVSSGVIHSVTRNERKKAPREMRW